MDTDTVNQGYDLALEAKHAARASISMAPQTKIEAKQMADDAGVSVSRIIEEAIRFQTKLRRILKREQAHIVAFVIQTSDGQEKTLHVL